MTAMTQSHAAMEALATTIDYLYDWGDHDDGRSATRFPVLRITPKSLWVHRHHFDYWNVCSTG